MQRLPLTDVQLVAVRHDMEKLMPSLYMLTTHSGPPYPSKRVVDLVDLAEKCLRRFKVDPHSLRPSSSSSSSSATAGVGKSGGGSPNSRGLDRLDNRKHQQKQYHHQGISAASVRLPPRMPEKSAGGLKRSSPPHGGARKSPPGIIPSISTIRNKTTNNASATMSLTPASTIKSNVAAAQPRLPSTALRLLPPPLSPLTIVSVKGVQQAVARDTHDMLARHRGRVGGSDGWIWMAPTGLSPSELVRFEKGLQEQEQEQRSAATGGRKENGEDGAGGGGQVDRHSGSGRSSEQGWDSVGGSDNDGGNGGASNSNGNDDARMSGGVGIGRGRGRMMSGWREYETGRTAAVAGV